MGQDKQQNHKCAHFNLVKGCKSCDQLFNLWNIKLIKAGHIEVEDFETPGIPLKSWDNLKFRGMNQDVLESKRAYFEACSNLLHDYKWDNEIHRDIWRLHSEGLSVREIVSKIHKKRFKRDSINLIIRHYQKELA